MKILLGIVSLALLAGLRLCTAQNCPVGYTALRTGCYKFVDDPKPQRQADADCRQMEGSSLVALTDSNKEDDVSSYVRLSKADSDQWDHYWTAGKERISTWYWAGDKSDIGPQGCYSVSDPRKLTEVNVNAPDGTNPASCHTKCKQDLYTAYSAVKIDRFTGRPKCYCTNEISTLTLAPNQCNVPCERDRQGYTYYCGGYDHYILTKLDAPSGFGRWVSNQPNNKEFDQRCMALGYGNEFKWIDEPCYHKMRHICQFELNQQECNSNSHRGISWFSDVSLPNFGACYLVSSSTTLDWFHANENCRNFIPGRSGSLVTITNRAFYNKLLDAALAKGPLDDSLINLPLYRADFWIGGRQTNILWILLNYGEETVRYTNFAAREPSDQTGDGCIAVSRNSNPVKYQWDMRPCSGSSPYVCQAAFIRDPPPSPSPPTPSKPIPPITPAPTTKKKKVPTATLR